jgi:hypothetical protein
MPGKLAIRWSMSERVVREWAEVSREAFALEAITNRHTPVIAHRISEREYPAGASFVGAAQGGLWYVLVGMCRITMDKSWVIASGQFIELPEGEYSFQVLGAQPVQLVCVWQIPVH